MAAAATVGNCKGQSQSPSPSRPEGIGIRVPLRIKTLTGGHAANLARSLALLDVACGGPGGTTNDGHFDYSQCSDVVFARYHSEACEGHGGDTCTCKLMLDGAIQRWSTPSLVVAATEGGCPAPVARGPVDNSGSGGKGRRRQMQTKQRGESEGRLRGSDTECACEAEAREIEALHMENLQLKAMLNRAGLGPL